MDTCRKETRILIANRDTHDVSVIDATTNQLIQTIAVGLNPDGMAVTPDGKTLYVANAADIECSTQTNQTVSVIDLDTNCVVSTIQVGRYPRRITVSPDGTRAYVTNYGSDNVFVIDTKTNTVTNMIELSDYPFGIATSPDGLFIYIVLAASSNVVVLDSTYYTVVSIIPLKGFRIEDIIISSEGNHAFLTCPSTGEIIVVDLKSHQVLSQIPVGFGFLSMAISVLRNTLFVTSSGDDALHVLNAIENRKIATGTVGLLPRGVAITRDNVRIYVANQADQTVSVIDTESLRVIGTIPLPESRGPRFVVISERRFEHEAP